MGVRHEGRELALQALYSRDFKGVRGSALLRNLPEEAAATSQGRKFAEELVDGVISNLEAIDSTISGKSKNWTIQRMSKVDLNILRIAVYELLYLADIPKNVTINEAIEVAKTFGTEESPAFVNGILDEISTSLPEK